MKSQLISPTTSQSRPADQFNKDNRADTSHFGANANYKKQARGFASHETPYRPAALEGLQQGLNSRARLQLAEQQSTPRSRKDEFLLGILDHVLKASPPSLTKSIAAQKVAPKANFIKSR